jgi:hypothetical protein
MSRISRSPWPSVLALSRDYGEVPNSGSTTGSRAGGGPGQRGRGTLKLSYLRYFTEDDSDAVTVVAVVVVEIDVEVV